MWQAAKSSNNGSASGVYRVNTSSKGRKIKTTQRNNFYIVEKVTLDFDIPWYVSSLLQNPWKTAILGLRMPLLSLALKHSKKAMA